MQDLNRATLLGTIVTEPTLRMAGDKSVCNFRLVTNRWGKDKQTSEFHSIICWDKTAENVSSFLNKGSRIYLEGRLQTREWVAVDGQKKQTTEIIADNIIFIDRKDKTERVEKVEQGKTLEDINAMVLQPTKQQTNEISLKDIPF